MWIAETLLSVFENVYVTQYCHAVAYYCQLLDIASCILLPVVK